MAKRTYFFNIIFILIFCLVVTNTSFAVDTTQIPNFFKQDGGELPTTHEVLSIIFSILTYVGYAAALILTTYTGIGFIIGGPAQKAKLKEKLWLIAFGVILLAAGIPLLQIVIDILFKFRETL